MKTFLEIIWDKEYNQGRNHKQLGGIINMKKVVGLLLTIVLVCAALSGCTSEAVKNVMTDIDQIGEVTLDSAPLLESINANYGLLSEEEKTQVENYSLLDEANAKYNDLVCQDLIRRIDSACSDVTSQSNEILTGLQIEYENLSEKLKQNITNYNILIESIDVCNQLAIIEAAEQDFQNGQYATALTKYVEITESDKYYSDVCEKIYEHGVDLYEQGLYGECLQYMTMLDDFKDSSSYKSISEVQQNLKDNVSYSYPYLVYALMKMGKNGFEPANELLLQEPLNLYMPLVEHAGLYRSVKTFKQQYWPLPAHDAYSYIDISTYITAFSFATEAFIEITSEAVQNQAEDNNFLYTCSYLADNKYHMDVKRYNNLSDNWEKISFTITLSDNKLKIDNLSTTEPKGQETFIEGAYTKIG